MDEKGHLRYRRGVAAGRQTWTNSSMTAKLGDAVKQLMEGWISPQQARCESVSKAWSELLPAGLVRHCKLAEISGGQLKVVADSPLYMHELRLCSRQLLEELQQRCPQAGIKRIKLAIG